MCFLPCFISFIMFYQLLKQDRYLFAEWIKWITLSNQRGSSEHCGGIVVQTSSYWCTYKGKHLSSLNACDEDALMKIKNQLFCCSKHVAQFLFSASERDLKANLDQKLTLGENIDTPCLYILLLLSAATVFCSLLFPYFQCRVMLIHAVSSQVVWIFTSLPSFTVVKEHE